MSEKSFQHPPDRTPDDDEITLIGETSPGVKRIEAISKHIARRDRWFLFFGVFLVAYVYGLDGTLRYTYQPYATGSYGAHSLLATLNVVRAVIAAAAQPTAAKLADVFGRVEVLVVSVVFYVVGTIVEAASHSLATFVGGAILYQIGYTTILLLAEVLIGDLTSTRARLFFSYIPALPFLINTWVSGNISSAVVASSSWRWGIGMFALIYPVCALPLIAALWLAHRRAKRVADLGNYATPYRMLGAGNLVVNLFWQLDVVGIVLLVAVMALILIPFTVAGGEAATPANWKAAHILAPLVIGVVLAPCWILWERNCKHPMVPFKLLKDRAVWSCIGIATMLNFAWYLQGDYLYTVLVVAFNQSVATATRVTSFYSFFSVIAGVAVGGVVFFVRRLKPFIVFGTLLFMVAFGMLIEFRGGRGSSAGVIGAQVLLGVAGGFFPYAAQASIQTATRHEHLAVVTGVYLASYNVGSALGNTLSGAIWTNILPGQLESRLAPVTTNTTMASAVYANPLVWVYEYPWDTPERDAVVQAYRHTQRLLTIAGICLCVPLIVFALLTRNPRLTDTQSIPGAEGFVSDSEGETPEVVRDREEKGFVQKLREKIGR